MGAKEFATPRRSFRQRWRPLAQAPARHAPAVARRESLAGHASSLPQRRLLCSRPEFIDDPDLCKALPLLANLALSLPGRPAGHDLFAWLVPGKLLAALHRELAGEERTCADVATRGETLAASRESARWHALAAMQVRYLQDVCCICYLLTGKPIGAPGSGTLQVLTTRFGWVQSALGEM